MSWREGEGGRGRERGRDALETGWPGDATHLHHILEEAMKSTIQWPRGTRSGPCKERQEYASAVSTQW